MRKRFLLIHRILVVCCLIFSVIVGFALAANSNPASKLPKPSRKNAFAAIGGRRYQPFYPYVVTPHAFVTEEKVYCAFQNTKGQPIVMAYDIKKRTWAGPSLASTFGLKNDTHGNPSIYADRQGHIHIFYGCHVTPLRHTKSAKPYDITKWEEQAPMAPKATYPQVMRLTDGTVYLFYRAGAHMEPWTLRTSIDDFKTWSKPQRIIEMRLNPPNPRAAAYACFFPGADGKTIHCFFNYKDDLADLVNRGRLKKHPLRPLKYKGLHEASYRYNIYYIRRNPDGAWVNATGKEISLPVSKAEADAGCMVFDSGDEFAYPDRLAVDNKNQPYIKIQTGVRDWGRTKRVIVPMRDKYAHFAKEKWQISDRMLVEWPKEVKIEMNATGVPAYSEKVIEQWYIFFQRAKLKKAVIFLYNLKSGYATREGGPAICGDTPCKPLHSNEL